MKGRAKKAIEILGAIYAVTVFAFCFIFMYIRWGTVEGFLAHWELIPSCAWHAGLWPFFAPMYFSGAFGQ